VSKETIDKAAVVAKLNQILEMELAGVVRYTDYSLMVFGYGRIPIVSWLRNEANEALMHAQEAGEMITQLGAHLPWASVLYWKRINMTSAISCGSRSNMKWLRCDCITSSWI
jgi:hypothetical protein